MQSRRSRIKELEKLLNDSHVDYFFQKAKVTRLISDLERQQYIIQNSNTESHRLLFENQNFRSDNNKLKSEIKSLKFENAVNQIMIDALTKTIEGIYEHKETDWEKKYHKVISKLEKITNKKPF